MSNIKLLILKFVVHSFLYFHLNQNFLFFLPIYKIKLYWLKPHSVLLLLEKINLGFTHISIAFCNTSANKGYGPRTSCIQYIKVLIKLKKKINWKSVVIFDWCLFWFSVFCREKLNAENYATSCIQMKSLLIMLDL